MPDFFTFKPFPNETDDPMREFRALCREVFPATPHAVLRRVAAVGALSRPSKGLLGSDPFYFEKAIRQCALEGLPIAPDFELTPINLLQGSAQDFIAPGFWIASDLLMFCAIYEPGEPLFRAHPLTQRLLVECPVSPHHLESDAWRRAARRCTPLAIFTVGDRAEVNEKHFVDAEYPQIHLSPETNVRLTFNHALLVRKDITRKAGLQTISPPAATSVFSSQTQSGSPPKKRQGEPIEPLGWFEEKLLGLAFKVLKARPLRKSLLSRFDPGQAVSSEGVPR